MNGETLVHLYPCMFGDCERVVLTHAGMSVSLFAWPGGVAGLRVTNDRGAVTLLPFQGQQVWDAAFDGRTLTMRSMFDQPHPTRE